VGWIMSIESPVGSRFSWMRANAVSSGEWPNTCSGWEEGGQSGWNRGRAWFGLIEGCRAGRGVQGKHVVGRVVGPPRSPCCSPCCCPCCSLTQQPSYSRPTQQPTVSHSAPSTAAHTAVECPPASAPG